MPKRTAGAVNPSDPNLDFQTIGPDGYAGVENQDGPLSQSFIRGAELGRDWDEPGGGDYTKVDALEGQEWQAHATRKVQALTLKQVSRAIAEALGGEYELVKGNGYFYIDGPGTELWYTTSIPVFSLNQLTLEQWVAEAKQLKDDHDYKYSPQYIQDLEDRFGGGGPIKLSTAGRRTAAHEAPDPCEYGPDCYGQLSDDAEFHGTYEVLASDIRGSAIKKEWPSIDDDSCQSLLRAWVAGEYDDSKPIDLLLVNGDYWVWDGHSRFTMLRRVNPEGAILCNVTERFPLGGDAVASFRLDELAEASGRFMTRSEVIEYGNGRPISAKRVVANAIDGDMELVIDGEPADPDELDGWDTYLKTEPTEMVRVDAPFTVETLEGPMSADAGDFLAVGPEGEMYPIDGDIQESTYRLAAKSKWKPGDVFTEGAFPVVVPPGISVVYSPANMGYAVIWGDNHLLGVKNTLDEVYSYLKFDLGAEEATTAARTADAKTFTTDIPCPLCGSPIVRTADDRYEGVYLDECRRCGMDTANDGELDEWGGASNQDYGDCPKCRGRMEFLEGFSRNGPYCSSCGFLPMLNPGGDTTRWLNSLSPSVRHTVEGERTVRVADNSPTGMFSWEGGQPDPFPDDETSMPNSGNPDGVNRNLSTEMRTDPARVGRMARTASRGHDPIADGLRMASRVVTARRRVGRSRHEVVSAIEDLRRHALPEQVARYQNMLNLDYDPDLILARIEEDRPYLQRM